MVTRWLMVVQGRRQRHFGHRHSSSGTPTASLWINECGEGARHDSKGSSKASHGGSGSTVMAGYVEVVMASIRSKGGSFPSLVAIGKANDSTVVTKRHGGVCTTARCVVELR